MTSVPQQAAILSDGYSTAWAILFSTRILFRFSTRILIKTMTPAPRWFKMSATEFPGGDGVLLTPRTRLPTTLRTIRAVATICSQPRSLRPGLSQVLQNPDR